MLQFHTLVWRRLSCLNWVIPFYVLALHRQLTPQYLRKLTHCVYYPKQPEILEEEKCNNRRNWPIKKHESQRSAIFTWKTPWASAATAVCSGVRPVLSCKLASPPASSKTLAASARAYLAARWRDVSPATLQRHSKYCTPRRSTHSTWLLSGETSHLACLSQC